MRLHRSSFQQRFFGLAQFLALGLLVALFAFPACGSTTGSADGTAGSTATAGTSPASPTVPAATKTPGGVPVKVYFSKHPQSDSDVNAVFSVNRVSPDLGVARFSLQQLIAGPTASEKASGLFTDLTTSLSGASNCGEDDFQLYPDHKGTTTPAPGTMTIKFCRGIQLAGDLTGARITAEINKTMLQFPNIHQVVILTKDGNCFNDFQGANACLN
ncbi:MAG TPA: hypothetical protein VFU63_07425 [Ktedonobacterales bacterium]|nr:hypothetical protein [Ktedonobacterales bacterium]